MDVGCGTGALLAELRDKGAEVFGLEYSTAALKYCAARGLSVMKFDLESGRSDLARVFDVAISTEVAEHLPARVADRYVDLLCRLSPKVVFTAAPPGQGGIDHVNEQPPAYWIEKFTNRGFQLDAKLSRKWSQDWKSSDQVQSYYYDNLMIFLRSSARDT